MAEGATLIAPETVWFSHDTKHRPRRRDRAERVLRPGVTVEDGVEIKANCHIEGARVGSGSRIGPFARLRPGADLGADVHIGNFVEVKNVAIGGRRQGQPSRLPRRRRGRREGATSAPARSSATTTASTSRRTEIGDGAFVGSNTSLVAPVQIGDGAYVGSGSVITKDVPAGRPGDRALRPGRHGKAGRRNSAAHDGASARRPRTPD